MVYICSTDYSPREGYNDSFDLDKDTDPALKRDPHTALGLNKDPDMALNLYKNPDPALKHKDSN